MISLVITSMLGARQEQMTKNLIDSAVLTSKNYVIETIVSASEGTFAQNVNSGLKKAKGNVILILNNDVTLLPGWAGWAEGFTNKEALFSLYPGFGMGWGIGITEYTRKVVGYMDERFVNSCEDYDYYIRCAFHGIPMTPAPRVYGLHEGGMTLNEIWGDMREMTPKRREICEANCALLAMKWPGLDIRNVATQAWGRDSVEIMKLWKACRKVSDDYGRA